MGRLPHKRGMERNKLVLLVARNLADAIERKGTNAAEVARKAGLNPTGVYDILSGKSRSPRLDTLQKIAVSGLGIPVSALLSDASDEALTDELVQEVALLTPEDRRKILLMARAFRADES